MISKRTMSRGGGAFELARCLCHSFVAEFQPLQDDVRHPRPLLFPDAILVDTCGYGTAAGC